MNPYNGVAVWCSREVRTVAKPQPVSRVELAMDAIRERIALAPGTRLPSIRRLAEHLRVSKSTIVEAYDRLVAEGAAEAKRGSGFFAAPRLRPFRLKDPGFQLDRAIDPLWIMRQALRLNATLQPGSGWLPDDWLAGDMLRRVLRGITRDEQANLTAYGSLQGYLPLREQLARRLNTRNIAAEPNNIFLTDSATRAIDIVCRFLLQPGDTVLIDDPCYFNFQYMLQAQRVRIIGIRYTPNGPDLEQFATACVEHGPKLYLTTAVLHNPTGATISLGTAHRILKLAEIHDLVLVEDSIYADLENRSSPGLAALDGFERVILVGSFSKTLTGAARCGFIIARNDWIDGLTDLALATSFGTNDLTAQATHRLLLDGSYRGHLDALRPRLARAMAFTVEHLERLGFELWIRPECGVFLWAQLPNQLDSADIAIRGLEHGLVLAPGNVFSVSQTANHFMRFNVAQCANKQVFEILVK